MPLIAGLFSPEGENGSRLEPIGKSERAESVGRLAATDASPSDLDGLDCFSDGWLTNHRAAAALLDADRRHLVLCRDPTGDHPLFYVELDGKIAFSSSPASLFPFSGSGVDLEGLARERSGWAGDPRTPFNRIVRVLPGERLTFGPAGPTGRHRITPLPAEPSRERWTTADIERGRHLLDQAVARCIPDSGIVASHLSSGRDSGAVTATASRLAGGRVLALTGAPAEGAVAGDQRGRFADESNLAAEIARDLLVPQETVRSSGALFDLLTPLVRTFQTALHPASNLSWLLGIAGRARSHGASTMLVGGMGNITLNAGGLPALQDLWRARHWTKFLAEVRAVTSRDDVRLRGAMAAAFGDWLPSSLMRTLGSKFADFAYPDADRFVRSHWHRPRPVSLPDYPGRRDWRASFAQDFHDNDPGLRRLGMEIGFGLRERDPFADRDLARFLYGLPTSAFLEGGKYRPFADALLSDRLPRKVLTAPRRGLQSADWLYRFDKAQAMAIVEEGRASSSAAEFLEFERLASEIADISRLKDEGFGKQIGHGWHVMEALVITVFLVQLERYPEDWGTSPMTLA